MSLFSKKVFSSLSSLFEIIFNEKTVLIKHPARDASLCIGQFELQKLQNTKITSEMPVPHSLGKYF